MFGQSQIILVFRVLLEKLSEKYPKVREQKKRTLSVVS